MRARITTLCFAIAFGCYREPDTVAGEPPREDTTAGDCVPGEEGCACTATGTCVAGLVCADARCARPEPVTTTVSSETSGTPTTGEADSSGGPTATTSSEEATTASSSGESSTGSVCDGTCLECQGCALAGPCSDEYAACSDGACGTVPFCLMSCAQQQHSCAECCLEATLALAEALVECVAQQCGLDCSFEC